LQSASKKSVRDLRRPKHRAGFMGLLKAGKPTLVNEVLSDSNVKVELPTDFKPSTAGIINIENDPDAAEPTVFDSTGAILSQGTEHVNEHIVKLNDEARQSRLPMHVTVRTRLPLDSVVSDVLGFGESDEYDEVIKTEMEQCDSIFVCVEALTFSTTSKDVLKLVKFGAACRDHLPTSLVVVLTKCDALPPDRAAAIRAYAEEQLQAAVDGIRGSSTVPLKFVFTSAEVYRLSALCRTRLQRGYDDMFDSENEERLLKSVACMHLAVKRFRGANEELLRVADEFNVASRSSFR